MHSIVWFFTTGIHDPAWVQAVAAIALVALTFVTLIVLSVYAWDTHTLAKTSKVSAEAAVKGSQVALAQTLAMIDKERARVFVVPPEHCSIRGSVSKFIGIIPQEFMFLNAGPTPAINVKVHYNAVLTLFETEATGKAKYQAAIQEVIAANNKATASFPVMNGFRSGRSPQIFYAHVWGEVKYNDVISSEQRGTKFRLRLTIKQSKGDEIANDGDWIKFGSPEDNRAT